MADPKSLTRDQLAKFLPDNDAIRRFERLFVQVGETIPQNIAIIFRLIQEVVIAAGNADQKAVMASDLIYNISQALDLLASAPVSDSGRLDAIASITRAIEEYSGTIDSKANQALSAIVDLARTLEVDATNPRFQMPNSFPVDYIDWNQTPSVSTQVARMEWNPADDTLNLHHSDGVTQQMGQELYGRITNNTGSTIPNGSALGVNPATNSYVLFIADGTLSPLNIVGVTTQEILNGAQGRITVWGQVHDLDTSGTPFGETWAAGDILYVSSTVAGGFTKVKPTAPNSSIPIAQVITVSATDGILAVRPTVEQQLYYGSFKKTADQTPSAANTADAITWSSSSIANGVTIGTPTSRIVVANAGLYKFSASFQLTSSSASIKNVWLWFRKNGTDVADSALITSMDSATAIRAPSRSLFFSLIAGDYIELMWASDSVNVTLDNIAATAFAPAAPAAILTVNQEQQ
jgi:hypothetical protein